MEPFVSAAWLAAHLDEVVVCDLRWSLDGSDGRPAYEAGHVPGAVYVDLDRELADPPSAERGRHPLPSAEDFTAVLARLGIGDDDTVVAYDQAYGGIAARLVWMLRATGRAAALLDGGIDAWDGPLETGAVTRPAATPTVRPWPAALLVDADGVAAAPVVLDARDHGRYRGDSAGPDARAGHIPGAVNVPVGLNVGPDGLLRAREDLLAVYAPLAAAAGEHGVVSSCGSGVTACHDLLVLEHLGLGVGRLYVGSWSQWAASDRPIETGDEPGAAG